MSRMTGKRALLESALRPVDLAFQNIDSIETGLSDIHHYFEYLGGVFAVVFIAVAARHLPCGPAEAGFVREILF